MEEDRRDNRRWEESLRDEIHNRIDERWRRRHNPGLSHLILGLAIVAIGVGLLLDNMGIYQIGNIWRYWPVILIAMGLSKIMDSPVSGGKLWGGFLFLIGCGFLADNLNLIHFSFNVIWPLLIIYFGGMMLWRGLAPAGGRSSSWNPNTGGSDPNSDFNYTAIFGGGKRRIESKTFHGGSAVAIFGGYNIDLRDAGMAGETANIDVNALFGGIDIRVPETWLVEVRANAIFGGVEDKTAPPRITEGQKPPRLIVTGFAAFGGIVVKS
jgi:predicted membrane protein